MVFGLTLDPNVNKTLLSSYTAPQGLTLARVALGFCVFEWKMIK